MTYVNWIKQRLQENNLDTSIVHKLYEQFKKETGSNASLDTFRRDVRKYASKFKETESLNLDPEDLLILEAQRQNLQDNNNYYRKVNRESFRIWNTLDSVFNTYIDLLKKVDLTKFNIKEHIFKNKEKKYGICQLSDLHLNELIIPEESNGNEYNFDVASKRLKKYIQESIKLFKTYEITDVYVLLSGDLINSNRRVVEKLAMITSQARASLLGTFLIQQALIELNQYFNVKVSYCVGNESRISEISPMDNSDILSSENWDFMIANNLRNIFHKSKIEFLKPDNNVQTLVRLPNGFNILMTHGHVFKSSSNIEKQTSYLLQSYLYRGIPINMVVYGHFHSASLGDIIARSSSLCGGNSYSSQDLMYFSRASQNIYIVNEDKGFHGIKIDLQNIDTVKEGYSLIEELEHYNISELKNGNQRIVSQNLV